MGGVEKYIKETIGGRTENWTPKSLRGEVQVLFMPLLRNVDYSKFCLDILTDVELSRAKEFIAKDDMENFSQRRIFRRYCGAMATGQHTRLREIEFHETAKGRPFLPTLDGCNFSFSSNKFGFIGAWSNTHYVGVDIEDHDVEWDVISLAREHFCRSELKCVEALRGAAQRQLFFQIWCLKEAGLKSIGEGLPFGLKAFEFELSPIPKVIIAPREHGGAGAFQAYLRGNDNGVSALVLKAKGGRITSS